MTMAEVLEAVAGLGKRFDRHAARLKALERETGMVDSDDPDPDDDDEEPRRKLRKPWRTTTIRTRIEAGPPGRLGSP